MLQLIKDLKTLHEVLDAHGIASFTREEMVLSLITKGRYGPVNLRHEAAGKLSDALIYLGFKTKVEKIPEKMVPINMSSIYVWYFKL